MLKLALIFFLISIVAGVLGFGGVSVAAAGLAKLFFVIFLVICLVFLVLGLTIAKRV